MMCINMGIEGAGKDCLINFHLIQLLLLVVVFMFRATQYKIVFVRWFVSLSVITLYKIQAKKDKIKVDQNNLIPGSAWTLSLRM